MRIALAVDVTSRGPDPASSRIRPSRSIKVPRMALGMCHRSRKARCTSRVWRVLRVHFPPEPPSELLRVGLPVMSQHSDPRSLCRGLTGHPRRSMSLIENSEIFRAKRSCENADSVTITTIFPTFKKKYGIFQKNISRYRGSETVLHFVRGPENRSQLSYQGRTDELGPVFPRQRLSMHPLIPAIVKRRS